MVGMGNEEGNSGLRPAPMHPKSAVVPAHDSTQLASGPTQAQ